MKPTDVYSSTYIDCGIKNIENDPEFKVGDHVRISKYINIFAKGYAPKKLLWLKSHKKLYHGHFKKTLERFKKRTRKRQTKNNSEVKKYKLYIKWKSYDNSFNSYIKWVIIQNHILIVKPK